MCGICGKVSWQNAIDKKVIEAMTDAMGHRGPDAEGSYVQGPVGLGHRRLSIIDLRECASQPMSDHSGRFWLVFNGEIYNYQDLRRELESDGSCFRTNSDTEVILESYKKWGYKCVERFNGMFAFALWDSVQERLVLARDRLGKKPLFYYIFPGQDITFASELKALLRDPAIPAHLNVEALSDYLSLNWIPTRHSIVKGVQKVEPAHYIVIEKGRPPHKVLYWDLAAKFRVKRHFSSEAEAAECLLDLFTDAVRRRMISDVPLGAFLSGGIDSSSIVAAMTRLCGDVNTHTYSIGFREKSYSELDYAQQVAKHLGVQHHFRMVDPDMSAELPSIVYYADEPFADTSMIPMYFLARFARKYVTVCLSGDGGDEIFGGYQTYLADKLHHYSQWVPESLGMLLLHKVLRWIPASYNKVSADYKVRQFLRGHGHGPIRAHCSWREIFAEDEKRKLVNRGLQDQVFAKSVWSVFETHAQAVDTCHYLDRAMYVDIKTWLVDDILVKVDRATMAHSLEARAPLLDYRLVEFAASLPVNLKIKGLRTKYLFKRSQQPYLPKKTVYRKKEGFNAPVSHWINSSLAPYLEELLRPGDHLCAQLFDLAYVKELWQHHCRRVADNSLKLLSLINFDLWSRQYRIS